jgi:hydroxyacylglutathione hydrolase
LGDREFEVIEIPGHTPGSVVLLCSEEKIMFSGDSIIATPAWLYLDHSLPLHTYLEGLQKIQERDTEFETIFPGHAPSPINKTVLYDLISCLEKIIVNPDVGSPTKTFAGEGLAFHYGSAEIIYNPNNF